MSTSVPADTAHDHAHHFESREHQYSAAKLGIWLFMLTEIVMFGGLFVGYAFLRSLYPEIFFDGHKYLDVTMGATNTIVLLTSSLTMALSISYIQTGQNKKAALNLWLTFACAFVFLIIKYFEYSHKIHDGLLPGHFFTHAGDHPEKIGMFFGIYFMMTGLHGVHVTAGIVLISWLLIKLYKGHFNPKYFTPVEGVGIFWHIVDLVWIFLFPMFYLIH
ncbi:MAG: cytochrome C oxidase subunit III [Bdellovibrionales bacterium CG10_big_fil_rev_8_21_14_0_10_45_34]|nr:MAG: cytochrome C oxidase subunit III [Bdellovibrionales bacterium CG10_big_fil_rev_8_21_14_0_10_45_34]